MVCAVSYLIGMDERDLRVLWEVFDRGDHIEDTELERLINSAQSGLCYLRSRGENLAAAKTAMDLSRLEGYRDARKRGDL